MKRAEGRKLEGLRKPISLVEACEILGDSKNLQDEAEAKLRTLEEAAASSQKMTSHQVSVHNIQGLYVQDGKSAGTAIFDQTKPLYLTNQNSLYFSVNQ